MQGDSWPCPNDIYARGINLSSISPARIVSLSVPLPLFKRNDAAIGQAMTDRSVYAINSGPASGNAVQVTGLNRYWATAVSRGVCGGVRT